MEVFNELAKIDSGQAAKEAAKAKVEKLKKERESALNELARKKREKKEAAAYKRCNFSIYLNIAQVQEMERFAEKIGMTTPQFIKAGSLSYLERCQQEEAEGLGYDKSKEPVDLVQMQMEENSARELAKLAKLIEGDEVAKKAQEEKDIEEFHRIQERKEREESQ
jgi:hypothetical protein